VTFYPSSTAGTTATSGAADTYGSAAELVAAGAVAAERRLAALTVGTPSEAMRYRIQLRYVSGGASSQLTERVGEFASDVGGLDVFEMHEEGGTIPSSAQITAKVMTSASSASVAVAVGLQVR